MNQFQSISSGQGELKDYYSNGTQKEAISEAIKRRRKKYMDSKNIPLEDEYVDKPTDYKPF